MDIQKALHDFIQFHEIENQSQYTIRNYRRFVTPFVDWLRSEQAVLDTDDLTVIHLRGWMSHLQKTRNKRGKISKDSTIRLIGASILAFCHWLEDEGIIDDSVTKRFKLPKVEQTFIPNFMSDVVRRMFDACEDCKNCAPAIRKALTARNKAVLAILIDTGIRVSELVALRLCDVDKDLRLLVVHRKGNRWQQVPVSRDGFKFLHDYLSKHRNHLAELTGRTVAHKEDAVFLGRFGEPITFHAVEKLFDR